jgi:preprotein translocase subunit YajC
MNEFRVTTEDIKTNLQVGDNVITEDYLCEVLEIGEESITVTNGIDTYKITYEEVHFFGKTPNIEF